MLSHRQQPNAHAVERQWRRVRICVWVCYCSWAEYPENQVHGDKNIIIWSSHIEYLTGFQFVCQKLWKCRKIVHYIVAKDKWCSVQLCRVTVHILADFIMLLFKLYILCIGLSVSLFHYNTSFHMASHPIADENDKNDCSWTRLKWEDAIISSGSWTFNSLNVYWSVCL